MLMSFSIVIKWARSLSGLGGTFVNMQAQTLDIK